MKQAGILLGVAALGVVVGALLVLFLARSASTLYLESEYFAETERMFSRGRQYEREGELQKAYALYFAVVNRFDESDSTRAEKWDLAFPLAYPVLLKMKEATDHDGKGTNRIDAMHRAVFGHLLEQLGKTDEANAQYSKAAKSAGVGVDRIKKLGETVAGGN